MSRHMIRCDKTSATPVSWRPKILRLHRFTEWSLMIAQSACLVYRMYVYVCTCVKAEECQRELGRRSN